MKRAFANYKQKKAEAKAEKKQKQAIVSFSGIKAAIVLHGCGEQDGTDVIEASSLLIALNLCEANVTCYAPDRMYAGVTNHSNGDTDESQERNILEESARITGGQVFQLNQLKSKNFDALFIPGGIGTILHSTNYIDKGSAMIVKKELENVILDFHKNKKYIGVGSMSALPVAKILGTENTGPGATITYGPDLENIHESLQEMYETAQKFGNEIKETPLEEILHDQQNKIISAPCKMYIDANPAQIFNNVKYMVDEVVKCSKAKVPQPITVFSTVEVNAEQQEEFVELMQNMSMQSRKEKGVVRFDVHQDAENQSTYNMYMVFRDADSIIAHKQTEHFQLFSEFKNQEDAILSQNSQILKGIAFAI